MHDVEHSPNRECKSCAMRRRMRAAVSTPEGKAKLQAMTNKAAVINRVRSAEFTRIRKLMVCAKKRCKDNPTYAGRGIEFRFSSPLIAAEWIIANLGYPEAGQSIDRIDNDGHYEAGNLRWATRTEQNSNRRAWVNGALGQRILDVQRHRDDLCYETIRGLLKKGLTIEEVIKYEKSKSGRPRLRHSERGSKAQVRSKWQTDT